MMCLRNIMFSIMKYAEYQSYLDMRGELQSWRSTLKLISYINPVYHWSKKKSSLKPVVGTVLG